MKKGEFSEFERLILHSGNQVSTSLLLILAWIAASDGDIDDREYQAILDIATVSEYSGDIKSLVILAQKRDIKAIQLASEVIRLHVKNEENAVLFLMMAIRTSVADGYLLPAENHILRYLGDLLEFSQDELNHVFRDATGRDFPDVEDLSSAEYWRAHNYENQRSHRDSRTDDDRTHSERGTKMSHFYATLGLNSGATKEEIKSAYRRLAKANHPDKFFSLGKEAVAVATVNFQRIKEAYDYLMEHA